MPSLWVVPEKSGGIRSYSEILVRALGAEVRMVDTLPPPESFANVSEPLLHIQHEFGLFGSKLPGRYRFPAWFRRAKSAAPGKKWVATAHTVLDERWRYPLGGRGWKTPLYSALNFFVPFFRKEWMDGTWSGFDGVIVHSELQRSVVERSGARKVAVIPHFVPNLADTAEESAVPTVVVFGYFSAEKGQDLAIRAWAELGRDAPKLVLAGDIRREEDRAYFRECLASIDRLGLRDRVEITGFVPTENVARMLSEATIVLAPFRATSGSGSIASALGAGAAILASDLPLNTEIDSRVPGAAAFFRSKSVADLAKSVQELLGDPSRRRALRTAAREYAARYSPERIAELHQRFYDEITR